MEKGLEVAWEQWQVATAAPPLGGVEGVEPKVQRQGCEVLVDAGDLSVRGLAKSIRLGIAPKCGGKTHGNSRCDCDVP